MSDRLGVGNWRQRVRFTSARLPKRSPTCAKFLLHCLAWLAVMFQSAHAQEIVEIEALSGTPLGVGRLTVKLPASAVLPVAGDTGFTLGEREQRVVYPALDTRPVRTALRDLLKRPQQATIYFLFTGDGPLTIDLYAPKLVSSRAQPRQDRAAYARLLASWWAEYSKNVQRDAKIDQYSPLLDNYLTMMLAARLRLTIPPKPANPLSLLLLGQKSADQAVDKLLGAESLRMALLKDTMSNGRSLAVADQPLPVSVAAQPAEYPEPAADVQIEAMAEHVPAECFYLRCGSFGNYQWFRHTLDDWGGDLRNLIAQRGMDFRINAKTERQIGMHESAVAGLLAPTLISDVAMIGQDPFFREGPAMGMIFQARNNFLLSRDFNGQRAATVAAEKNCTDQTLEIAGHQVSLISTPDNAVRCFYAVDGDFHLLTTSRTLVRRFYEAGAGKNSLAKSRGFRNARTRLPLTRDDSVLIYLSEEFFSNLMSPQYHIELTRRLQAGADADLLRLARLAAVAEHHPAESVQQLIAAGFLPLGFDHRADGGQVTVNGGIATDSLRGATGTFLPVPDMRLDRVTRDEIKNYEQFATLFQEQWGQMDPVAIGIQRRTVDRHPGLQHVTIDAQLLPFAKRHLGMLEKSLGPTSNRRVSRTPGDVASLEFVASGSLLGGGQVTQIFAGMRDSNPPLELVGSKLLPLKLPSMVDGYVGAWPHAGPLSYFGYRADTQLDADGFGSPRANLFQRSWNDFHVVSNHSETLKTVTRELHVEDSARPAQAWLHINDITDQKFSEFANAYAYTQARKVSAGNLEFLRQLQTQLHVPAAEAKDVAELLLGGRMVCTVGGQYQLQERQGEPSAWTSTAFAGPRNRLGMKSPDGYRSPALQWFRGLDLDFGAADQALISHIELEMQQPLIIPSAKALPPAAVPVSAQPTRP